MHQRFANLFFSRAIGDRRDHVMMQCMGTTVRGQQRDVDQAAIAPVEAFAPPHRAETKLGHQFLQRFGEITGVRETGVDMRLAQHGLPDRQAFFESF